MKILAFGMVARARDWENKVAQAEREIAGFAGGVANYYSERDWGLGTGGSGGAGQS